MSRLENNRIFFCLWVLLHLFFKVDINLTERTPTPPLPTPQKTTKNQIQDVKKEKSEHSLGQEDGRKSIGERA